MSERHSLGKTVLSVSKAVAGYILHMIQPLILKGSHSINDNQLK